MVTLLLTFATCLAIDGDTLRCNGTCYRLARIDAPEMSEPAGPSSRDHLRMLIQGKPVTCTWWRRDRYGRPIAECWAGPGESLSDGMLKDGMAVLHDLHCPLGYACRMPTNPLD